MVRRRLEKLRAVCARRRWSESDAQQVVDALEASGESVAAFARRLGLVPIRIHRWRQRVQGGPSRTIETCGASGTLIPVTVRMSGGAEPAVVLSTEGGVRVEVHDVAAASPSWLAELMRALEADA